MVLTDEMPITESTIQTTAVGLSVVSFLPLLYLMIVLLLQSMIGGVAEASDKDNNIMDILAYVFIFLSFLIIVVVSLKLTTIVRSARSFAQLFLKTVISLALLEMISVLGMAHALIALLVFDTNVNMPLVIGTSVTSIMSMLIFTYRVVVPSAKKFVGLKYTEEIDPFVTSY